MSHDDNGKNSTDRKDEKKQPNEDYKRRIFSTKITRRKSLVSISAIYGLLTGIPKARGNDNSTTIRVRKGEPAHPNEEMFKEVPQDWKDNMLHAREVRMSIKNIC